MLIPAIIRKSEIEQTIKNLYYTDDMMYLSGCMDNWLPNIVEMPESWQRQYAIVDSNEKLIGYLAYNIDWYSSVASCFAVVSFDKGNILVGKALFDELEKLINDYKLHRIEWRMVGGNPVEKHYDKFCEKYKGKKHILTDVIKDKHGNYHDDIIYEIIT